jgi:hypothetical protein
MPKSSLEELRGKISTGEYAIDSGMLAADILSKFALIGRVRRLLVSDEEGSEHPGPSESLRRATSAYGKKSA